MNITKEIIKTYEYTIPIFGINWTIQLEENIKMGKRVALKYIKEDIKQINLEDGKLILFIQGDNKGYIYKMTEIKMDDTDLQFVTKNLLQKDEQLKKYISDLDKEIIFPYIVKKYL